MDESQFERMTLGVREKRVQGALALTARPCRCFAPFRLVAGIGQILARPWGCRGSATELYADVWQTANARHTLEGVMYDEDPALFLAGASGFGAAGVGGLAFTGSQTLLLAVIGISAIVVGLLLVRLAVRSRDRASNSC